jgi:hypothetical protein
MSKFRQLHQFLAGNRATQLGGFGIDLNQSFSPCTVTCWFSLPTCNLQGDVDAGILGHARRDALCLVHAKARCSDAKIVLARREGGCDLCAGGVRG